MRDFHRIGNAVEQIQLGQTGYRVCWRRRRAVLGNGWRIPDGVRCLLNNDTPPGKKPPVN